MLKVLFRFLSSLLGRSRLSPVALMVREYRSFKRLPEHKVPSTERLTELQAGLYRVNSEFIAYLESVYGVTAEVQHLRHLLEDLADTRPVKIDMTNTVRGLTALEYEVENLRQSLGINGLPFVVEYHRVRMCRPGPLTHNVRGLLAQQGWKPQMGEVVHTTRPPLGTLRPER